MVDVIPFPCVRPSEGMVAEVASLPYDVFNLDEARTEIECHPHSFLRIDMPEATFTKPIDHNDDAVFEKGRDLLEEAVSQGTYITDATPHYYLYRLRTPEGQDQTGVVAASSIDDYQAGRIKKHEKTRADKEVNRIRHVDTLSAQTGPIFLAFRSNGLVEQVMNAYAALPPLYDFTADDGVRHTVWCVDRPEDTKRIKQAFEATDALYIADGHHRAASAVKAGLLRREKAQLSDDSSTSDTPLASNTSQDSGTPSTTEPEHCETVLESDHFLSVIFPSDQLTILDYNRVVTDLNGLDHTTFIKHIEERFEVSGPRNQAYKPSRKGSFGMYLDGLWYELCIKDAFLSEDPVSGLDVALLQDNLLDPILGITDPRTDKRIGFVGGIRGLEELERRVSEDMAVAFALYPTSIDELFKVADADMLMPPKSTWFEPKLRSGIFIHRI